MNALRNIKAPHSNLSIRYNSVHGWRIRQGEIRGTNLPILEDALADWNGKAERDNEKAIGATLAVPGGGMPEWASVRLDKIEGWSNAEAAFITALAAVCPVGSLIGTWPWEAPEQESKLAAKRPMMHLDGDISEHRRLAEQIGFILNPGDKMEINPGSVGTKGAEPLNKRTRLDPFRSSPEFLVAFGAPVRRTAKETAEALRDVLTGCPGIGNLEMREFAPNRWNLQFTTITSGSPEAWPEECHGMLDKATREGDVALVEALVSDHRQRCTMAGIAKEARENHVEPEYVELPEELRKPGLKGTETPGCGDPLCPYELLDSAWGIIANAGGGNWAVEPLTWQKAAHAWRDRFFQFVRNGIKESEAEEKKEREELMQARQAAGDPVAQMFRQTREGIEEREALHKEESDKLKSVLRKSLLEKRSGNPPPMPKGLLSFILLSAMLGAADKRD